MNDLGNRTCSVIFIVITAAGFSRNSEDYFPKEEIMLGEWHGMNKTGYCENNFAGRLIDYLGTGEHCRTELAHPIR